MNAMGPLPGPCGAAAVPGGRGRAGRVAVMSESAAQPEGREPRRRMHYGEGREALLNAAVRVVARGGLRKLTYRAVAQEAGTTHGLVVHHFGSRDALIEAALTHAIRTSLSTSALEPGTGEVADFSAGLSEMVTADPDIQAFQYELLLESRRRPELLPQIRALYEDYFDATGRELSRILPEGAGRALNRLVFAALDGLVLHQLVFGEPEVTDGAVEELHRLIRLLKPEGDSGAPSQS